MQSLFYTNTIFSSRLLWWFLTGTGVFEPVQLAWRSFRQKLKIVNIKYISVNIKTSLFTSSLEIIGKYVMICNKRLNG